MTKYGVMMNLPDGKLPGFYAQIIKALANQTTLFDRDKELLIVHTEEERSSVIKVLEHFGVSFEPIELILLPDDAVLSPHSDDYGFSSRANFTYLYKELVSIFYIKAESSNSEKNQALLQIQEHLIAQYKESQNTYYVIDKQFNDLMKGIAKAYKCEIIIIDL